MTGSGVVISPTQVLTNYHVVHASTDVSISLDGQSDRLSGTVEAVAPGIDLALIALDEMLPDHVKPLELALSTPKTGSKIQVFGYPKGGESLSVTEGVVSRIEYVDYRFRTGGLRTQIDAPLNSGNSGGPVVADGKVVGIANSSLNSSNDINYAIPCEELTTFLSDLADGSYDGKPQMWLHAQSLESKQLRKWLKMPDDASGVRFAAMPIPLKDYPLQKNDVITHIGGYDVSNLGKVAYDGATQVAIEYAVDKAAKGGMVTATILRDGEEMEVEIPVFRDGRYLLKHQFDEPPSYFVLGPIVFGVASAEFWDALDFAIARGGDSAKSASTLLKLFRESENPLLLRRNDRIKEPGEQLVVISKIISNRLTRDIRVLAPAVVGTINGHRVPNLRAAAKLLSSADEDLLEIELDDNRHTMIVLSRREIEEEHDQIMEDNGIFHAASKNLRDVWEK